MTGDPFAPLVAELDRWAEAGRTAPFWLRDDDAETPSAALDRLLDLTGRCGVPLTLAVIPAGTGPALAERLGTAPHVRVAVHGWSHANHAPEGEKKQELGAHRPAAAVLDELARGKDRLQALHGARAVPLLVPPWNRISPGLLPDLPALGFTALSVFGPEAAGPLPSLNVHVDPIDWHGTRGLRDPAAVVAETVARLRAIERGGAVGLMTHHRVHDVAIRDFLEAFLTVTAGHPGCRWHDVAALLQG